MYNYFQINEYGDSSCNVSITNISITTDSTDPNSSMSIDYLFNFCNGYSLLIDQINISNYPYYFITIKYFSFKWQTLRSQTWLYEGFSDFLHKLAIAII